MSDKSKLLLIAYNSPETFVAQITYLAADGTVTDRAVSPICYLDNERLRVYCLGREAIRTLKLACILRVRLKLSADVLCPEAIADLVSHHRKLRRDFAGQESGEASTPI